MLTNIGPPQQLLAPMFGRLPRSETWGRRYYGRSIDLVAIESAILMAQIGVMSPMSDLARESIRNDPGVSGMLFRRFSNLAACDWDVQPPSSGVDVNRAQQIADACRSALLRFRGFRQFLYDMAWGAFDGRAACEIDWDITAGPVRYWPVSHTWIHPGRLSFGPNRDLRVIERHQQTSLFYQVGLPLDELTPGKVVQWLPRNFSDYAEREGLAPRLLYWLLFKRLSWRWRMTLTELFALPWRIIETKAGDGIPVPTGDMLDDAAAQAEELGGESTLALQPGQTLQVVPPHPESGTLFGMNSEEVNDELAKLILMQPKTSTGETNRAAGVIADKQQDAALVHDGTGLQEAITEQLLRPFVELNFGADDLVNTPRLFLRTDPPRDRKADLERATMVMGMGLPLSAAEVYEVSGYRKPRSGEATLKPKAAVAGLPAGAPAAPGAAGPAAPTATGAAGDLQDAGEAGSVADAVASLLDAFDTDMLNAPDDGSTDTGLAAERVELDAGLGKLLQPSSANGSPEPLIAAGVREAAKHSASWGREMAAACEGHDTATGLYSALAKAAAKLEAEKFTRAVERKIVHGLMLGALDAQTEMIGDAPLKPAAFEREGIDHLELDLGVPGFATKPFAEAIKAFAQKRVIGRRAFDRLAAEAKRRAFTVAGLARASMLEAAHGELTKAITEGADLSTFRRSLTERFESAGWTPLNPSHVETVFRTNVMSSYSQGRDAQQRDPAVLAARPFWQLVGVNDDRARPTHKAAHGKVLRADDPFWAKTNGHMGFNCRCRRVSRSAADLERLGLSVTSGAELRDLPDPGFDG